MNYSQPEVTVYLVLYLSSFWLADVPVRGFSPGLFRLAKSILWVTEAWWEETLLCMLDGPINEDKHFLAYVLCQINGSRLGDFEEQQPSEKCHRLKKTQLYHWTRNATRALLLIVFLVWRLNHSPPGDVRKSSNALLLLGDHTLWKSVGFQFSLYFYFFAEGCKQRAKPTMLVWFGVTTPPPKTKPTTQNIKPSTLSYECRLRIFYANAASGLSKYSGIDSCMLLPQRERTPWLWGASCIMRLPSTRESQIQQQQPRVG